jgi:hypothetical protein
MVGIEGQMKLDRRIREALEETGLPWLLEPGKGHLKLRVGGRLAGIISTSSKCEGAQRNALNTVSQIRRVARSIAA